MTTLEQLEKEERELLKRLAQVRKEKSKLKVKPVKQTTSTLDTSYTRDALETKTKKELLTICKSLNITPLSSDNKTNLIDHIIRNQRAKNRGEAFRSMLG